MSTNKQKTLQEKEKGNKGNGKKILTPNTSLEMIENPRNDIYSPEAYEQYIIAQRTKAQEILSKKRTYKDLLEFTVLENERRSMESVAIGNMVLLMDDSRGVISECQVFDDRYLQAYVGGKRKEYAVFHEPITVFMDMRNYWVGRGLINKIKLTCAKFFLKLCRVSDYGILKFNLYGIRTDGEFTIDLSKDLTPPQLARKVEAFLKIKGKVLKANIAANFLSGLKGLEPWWKSGMYLIVIVLIVFMFLFYSTPK